MRARDAAWAAAGAWAGGAVAAFLVIVIGGSDLAFWPWAVFVPVWWPLLMLTFEGHTLETSGFILVSALVGAASAVWAGRRRERG